MDRSKYGLRSSGALEGKEKGETEKFDQMEKGESPVPTVRRGRGDRSDGKGRETSESGDNTIKSVQVNIPESPTDKTLERSSLANTGMPGTEVFQGGTSTSLSDTVL